MILFIQFYWSEKSFCIVAYLNFSHFSVAKNPDKCRLLNFNEWQVHEPYLSPKDIELIQHQYGRFCTLVWNYFWKSMRNGMVFCYQNCSDLLWEKNVLVIKKIFCKHYEITRTIYSNSEMPEQFLVIECSWRFLRAHKN